MGARRNKQIACQGTEGLAAPIRQERLWRAIHRESARFKQGNRCVYCLEPIRRSTATADHMAPKIKGGRTSARNIAAACHACNSAKSAMIELAFEKAVQQLRAEHKFSVQLAHVRRRIWLREQLAERRILNFVGLEI